MRAAYSVASHSLEYLQLALYGTLIGSCAQTAQVVVVADTVYAYMLTVQVKSAVSAELYGTDSERGFICVYPFTVQGKFGNQCVHVRVINTPQMRRIHPNAIINNYYRFHSSSPIEISACS